MPNTASPYKCYIDGWVTAYKKTTNVVLPTLLKSGDDIVVIRVLYEKVLNLTTKILFDPLWQKTTLGNHHH